jgi:hypothetical protein
MMTKEFNITGTCIPELHYMADISEKLKPTLDLVERGKYFVISRPRQFGKTTILVGLHRILAKSEAYFPISISFEGIGKDQYANDLSFSKAFLNLLKAEFFELGNLELTAWLESQVDNFGDSTKLDAIISELVRKFPKKVVLLIDEVDRSGNNEVFLRFLGLLRNKYLSVLRGSGKTFDSVILAGLHDVKILKSRLRPEDDQQFNSPWNIASEYPVDLSLSVLEIIPMLEEYQDASKISMDTALIAEKLIWFTAGYPFLVSKLCKMLAENIIPASNKSKWEIADLEFAASELVKEGNTNFDSLIKNLEANKGLHDLIFDMIINVKTVSYNVHNPLIALGLVHGILANGSGLRIHNRIYAEVLYNYFSSKVETSQFFSGPNPSTAFQVTNRKLDMAKILARFQLFMKEQYSCKDRDFLERHGRLIFLAFIKPIINGGGYDFKEPEISEERRIDVAITYYAEKYIVELKIWYGEVAHQQGLEQLANYLDRQNQNEGYLVIFDHSETKTWQSQTYQLHGKTISAVWV